MIITHKKLATNLVNKYKEATHTQFAVINSCEKSGCWTLEVKINGITVFNKVKANPKKQNPMDFEEELFGEFVDSMFIFGLKAMSYAMTNQKEPFAPNQ